MEGRLKISFSGGGRKSSMGSLAARASVTDLGVSVYLLLFFIKVSPLTPESGAENSNSIFAVTKTDGQHFIVNFTKTKVALFFLSAVFAVNSYHPLRVRISQLCFKERDSMLRVPLKLHLLIEPYFLQYCKTDE